MAKSHGGDHLRADPNIDPAKQKSTTGFLPILSDIFPAKTPAIAIPNNPVSGMKYVAAEKSNGAVLGKESGCEPGSAMRA